MKFMIILLLVAASHAADLRNARNKPKSQDANTDKTALNEENSNVDKRASGILSTEAPSVTPGIEYADSKEPQQEKSPVQQIYATPVPQIAKISDVLTGQGPPFQAAIASHLYSPVSVYQARLATPTTYEVSAPVPSQLAYSEHKVYQPQQNVIQYAPQPQPQALRHINIARLPNYQQPYAQQILVQPQPILYTQPIHQQQPIVQQIPQLPYQQLPIPQQIYRPIQYIQNPSVAYPYVQQPQPQTLIPVPIQQIQPGITYVQGPSERQQNLLVENGQQLVQNQTPRPQETVVIKETTVPQQKINIQPQASEAYRQQGAVSYASFSQSQPATTYLPQKPQQQLQQPQYQRQPQVQYQNQIQQPQAQYRIQPLNTNIKSEASENLTSQSKTSNQVAFFRPGPTLQVQPLMAQQGRLLAPNPGYVAQTSPTFPPIQYFGKMAPAIFSRYNNNNN